MKEQSLDEITARIVELENAETIASLQRLWRITTRHFSSTELMPNSESSRKGSLVKGIWKKLNRSTPDTPGTATHTGLVMINKTERPCTLSLHASAKNFKHDHGTIDIEIEGLNKLEINHLPPPQDDLFAESFLTLSTENGTIVTEYVDKDKLMPYLMALPTFQKSTCK